MFLAAWEGRGRVPLLDKAVGYFGLAFALAIALRVILVRRAIKKSPVVALTGWSAHDLWHLVLGVIIKLEAMSIVLFRLPAHFPSMNFYGLFLPFSALRHPAIEAAGLLLALAGLMWSVTAQAQMGRNWRIGNDPDGATELVRSGLYARSRNPIYIGFIAIAAGLFLAMPNAVTLLCAVATPWVLARIVALEEAFQRARHGAAFDAYAQQVRRWL